MQAKKGESWSYLPDKLVCNRHDYLSYEQVYCWNRTQEEMVEELRGREETLLSKLEEEDRQLLDAYTTCLASLLSRVADNTYYTGLITGMQRMYQENGRWPLDQ